MRCIGIWMIVLRKTDCRNDVYAGDAGLRQWSWVNVRERGERERRWANSLLLAPRSWIYMIFTFKYQCIHFIYFTPQTHFFQFLAKVICTWVLSNTQWASPAVRLGSNFERRHRARLLPFVSQELLGLGASHREGTASPVASRYGPAVYWAWVCSPENSKICKHAPKNPDSLEVLCWFGFFFFN